jgi:hypothetical protein
MFVAYFNEPAPSFIWIGVDVGTRRQDLGEIAELQEVDRRLQADRNAPTFIDLQAE